MRSRAKQFIAPSHWPGLRWQRTDLEFRNRPDFMPAIDRAVRENAGGLLQTFGLDRILEVADSDLLISDLVIKSSRMGLDLRSAFPAPAVGIEDMVCQNLHDLRTAM